MSAVLNFPAKRVGPSRAEMLRRFEQEHAFRIRALMGIGFTGASVAIPHVTCSAQGVLRVEREPVAVVAVELLQHEGPASLLARAIESSACEHVKELANEMTARVAALEAAGEPAEPPHKLCDFDSVATKLMAVLRESCCPLIRALRVSLAGRAAASRAADLAEWECQQ